MDDTEHKDSFWFAILHKHFCWAVISKEWQEKQLRTLCKKVFNQFHEITKQASSTCDLSLLSSLYCTYETYSIYKLRPLVCEDSLRCFKLVHKLQETPSDFFCCLRWKGISLWPLSEVVQHDANVLVPSVGDCQLPNEVHSDQLKWLFNLEEMNEWQKYLPFYIWFSIFHLNVKCLIRKHRINHYDSLLLLRHTKHKLY